MTTLSQRLGILTRVWTARGSNHNIEEFAQDNQDYVSVINGDQHLALVVCDGCSSSRLSKVGAVVTTELVKTSLRLRVPALLSIGTQREIADEKAEFALRLARLLRCDVLKGLDNLAFTLAGGESSAYKSFVEEALMCTVLVAVITERYAVLMGLGDGAFEINGNLTLIKPVCASSPSFLAFALLDSQERKTHFQIYGAYDLQHIKSVGVFSDGIEHLIRSEGKLALCESKRVASWDRFGDRTGNGLANYAPKLAVDQRLPALHLNGESRVGIAAESGWEYLDDDCSGARAIFERQVNVQKGEDHGPAAI